MIGTEILQFGYREAEIIEFKEGWGLKSLSSQRIIQVVDKCLEVIRNIDVQDLKSATQ